MTPDPNLQRGDSQMSMSPDLASIERLAALLLRDPKDPTALGSAERLLHAGHGAPLLAALLDQAGAPESRLDAVLGVMPKLEAMMDAAPFVATYLMARLYPIAAELHEHPVCDAIHLWMHSRSPAPSLEALQQLVGEGLRPRFQKQIAAWIAVIESH